MFHACCKRLGFGPAGHHLYSLRHGGVSHDLLHGHYTLEEAQRRGRWLSKTALRRYAKETRLLSEMSKLNPALVDFAKLVEQRFSDVVSGAFKPGIPLHALVSPHHRAPARRLAKTFVKKRPSRAVP